MTTVKGYKVTNADGTCRGFKFEVGNTYEHEGRLEICSSGFHFCIKPSHCFNYYSFNSDNKVFEVEAIGDVVYKTDDSDTKAATNKISIIREISWNEVLQIVNEGGNNTGHSNTGDRNTGDRNTGDRNTGDRNTGNRNTGYSNTGNRNTGNRNTGNRNTGDRNTGDWNTGNSNTGNSNTGDWNTGDRNTGDWNTGYSNTGNRNTGDWNTGNSNTGYSNTGNSNTGLFCTGDAPFPIFNKPSRWTESDFHNSRAYQLMSGYVNTKIWVEEYQMTEEEKSQYPSYKTCGGFLRDIPYKEAFKNAWHNFDSESRKAFTDLPNFDATIFMEITGVNVNE